jgi:hypothetical protein
LRATPLDEAPIPETLLSLGSAYQVNVSQVVPGDHRLLLLEATGRALPGADLNAPAVAEQQLTVHVWRAAGFPVLGAVTVVTEDQGSLNDGGLDNDLRFFNGDHGATISLNGCDPVTGECLHALTLLTGRAYDEVVEELVDATHRHGDFGERLYGARPDFGDQLPRIDGHGPYPVDRDPHNPNIYEYSIHRATDAERGSLGHTWLRELAAFAMEQAKQNNCYVNGKPGPNGELWNDDLASNDSIFSDPEQTFNTPPDLVIQSHSGPNSKFGAIGNEKICFIDYPYPRDPSTGDIKMDTTGGGDGSYDIQMRNTVEGAGLLVIRGELEVGEDDYPADFTYHGVVVILGPSAELEVKRTAHISGGILMGTTEQHCRREHWGQSCGSSQIKWQQPELNFDETGSLTYQYSRANVQPIEELLLQLGSGLLGPTAMQPGIRSWVEDNTPPPPPPDQDDDDEEDDEDEDDEDDDDDEDEEEDD